MSLPIFYFPVKILCIDDDLSMLDSLKNLLADDYKFDSFSNPQKALKYLERYSSHLNQINFFKIAENREEYDKTDLILINLNINKLIDLSQDIERYTNIGIVIIDYQMAKLNGIEICKILKGTPYKKILLTATADEHEANIAFNDKLIDVYMSKNVGNLSNTLKIHVKNLIHQFFIEQTLILKSHLEIKVKLPISDPYFYNFFIGWLNKNRITEYFVMDKNGSVLALSGREEKLLIIHTDDSLDEIAKLYDDDIELAPHIEQISSRKKIPFFGKGVSHDQIEPRLWLNHLFEPEIVDGVKRYYCCEI